MTWRDTDTHGSLHHLVVPLRDPDEIMTLACMGSAHQHRLSFMRILLRRLKRERWSFARTLWNLDANGYGTAVYTASSPERSYSLIAFSHYLEPEKRSDRVIATAWDATFTLFDGIPAPADIERLRGNVPKQEAGRVSSQELSVSRANKSVRLFDHVVDRLASGRQPDEALIGSVGYLMRTTAVYGSGKLGAADYDAIASRPEFNAPYQAEMLSVYLIRQFSLDLVEHVARERSPGSAALLAAPLKRRFGIGNSTGLGMAPYLVNHPMLLNSWVLARETALARVRSIPRASEADKATVLELVIRAKTGLDAWRTDDASQQHRVARLRGVLERLEAVLTSASLETNYPWDRLYLWANRQLSLEARELAASLLIEAHGALVDDLESLYRVNERDRFRIDGARKIQDLMVCLDRCYGWIVKFDFAKKEQNARFWYTSEEKLEPRLGERWQEGGSEHEHPLAIARNMQALRTALESWDASDSIAKFLLAHPEHRHSLRRVLIAEHCPYAEIRDNVIDGSMRPIDILRFKLSFFGATRFDPRSDRWVRITMFQHAPCMDELANMDADDWFLPPLPPEHPCSSR